MADNDSHSSAAAAAAAAAAADKKRNKLGYHRTAIACGHCRRRKIRCIPPADATSNRCQNCVRLKKDCQYYPVDQSTPATTKRSRNDTKGDGLNTESEASVSSSSPGISMGTMDQYDPYRTHGGPYPPLSEPKTMMVGNEQDYGYQSQYPGGAWAPQDSQSRFYPDNRNSGGAQGHDYWPASEQMSQAPFGTPIYAMSSNETSTGLTAADHPYTNIPSTIQEYPYSPGQGRTDQIANGTPLNSFGLYRSGAIPDSSDMQSAMNIPTQAITNPAYPTTSPHTQYPSGPVLAPRWTDATQMQPTYPQHGTQQNWFSPNTANPQDKSHNPHVLVSQNESRHQYRGNPG